MVTAPNSDNIRMKTGFEGLHPRKWFNRIPSVMEMPNLMETQQRSYREFLWAVDDPEETALEDFPGELFRQLTQWLVGRKVTRDIANPNAPEEVLISAGTVLDYDDIRRMGKVVFGDIFLEDHAGVEEIIARYNKPGLQQAFESIFPIKGRDGSEMEFGSFNLGRPKYTVPECVDRGMTYGASLRITVRLVVREPADGDKIGKIIDVRTEDIYLGEMPLITHKGTFIINGAERVIVSQLHRSPGPVFDIDLHPSGRRLVKAQIIPNRGAWLEFETDVNYAVYAVVDRKKKLPATTLLRAFGFNTNEEIWRALTQVDEVKITSKTPKAQLLGKVLVNNVVDTETGEAIVLAGTRIDEDLASLLKDKSVGSTLLAQGADLMLTMLSETIHRDKTTSTEEALLEVYQVLRPGEPAAVKNAQTVLENLFTKARRYDLSRVGRYRMNRKLNIHRPLEEFVLTMEDLLGMMKYIVRLLSNDPNAQPDDIDHLGNRRVRTVGELLDNQIRLGLARMERSIREKMGIMDLKDIMPRTLINSKPITAAVNEFFGRSQLSQFLDQVNPLSELTHKRRLSALGRGGLNRERAGFEVRDVHHTHYGRICPIETPEGPNIGLINSLSTYARINDVGFIESPYRKVVEGRVTNDIYFLEALDEDEAVIAQANAWVDEQNKKFLADLVSVRACGEASQISPDQVQYMDVSPMQLVSVSAALIPFLEHDDANRALMGSNMQRQAVPLLKREAPLVGTGIEYKSACDSGVVVVAERAGTVTRVEADRIEIDPDSKTYGSRWSLTEVDPRQYLSSAEKGPCDVYRLTKFGRSNQNTCVNQTPVVQVGQHVNKGDVLADGPATSHGELALGKNILVAFMSWEGYNFEDAILVSERLIKDQTFTSVHIEEFKTEARDTKLGEEEITRDIPNVGEESLRDLDENGIIRIGASVKPGDILVGKISPKGKVQTSNVEKLLRAIFGKRAEDVRDISLKSPPGTYGTVVDVKVFSRKQRSAKNRQEEEQILNRLKRESEEVDQRLRQEWENQLREAVLGQTLANDLVDPSTGEIIMPAGTVLDGVTLKKNEGVKLAMTGLRVQESRVPESLEREFMRRLEEVRSEYDKQIDYLKTGDNLPPGVIKMVKVYVAKRRQLSVGDKMAGRHGNKGVVSRIMREEDMPYMEDGTPVDIVLNPLGVPSRMNVGQVLETHLGWAAHVLCKPMATPVFDGAHESEIKVEMSLADTTMQIAGLVEVEQCELARVLIKYAADVLDVSKLYHDHEESGQQAAEFMEAMTANRSACRLIEALSAVRVEYKNLVEAQAAFDLPTVVPFLESGLVMKDYTELARKLEQLRQVWSMPHADVSESKVHNQIADELDLLVKMLGSNADMIEHDLHKVPACLKSIEQLLPEVLPEHIDRLLGDQDDLETQEVRDSNLRCMLELLYDRQYEQAIHLVHEGGLARARIPFEGKAKIYDGRTGEPFEGKVTLGYIYMLKLNHLIDDKIHARSIGPYSLVTQQPLGGKAQFGGQRLGEMEVWALEAHGVAHTLQELVTVKSDDISGRNKIYESIVKGTEVEPPGLPESFYVLVKEMQSLALGVELIEDDSGVNPDSMLSELLHCPESSRRIFSNQSASTKVK